MFTIQNRLLNPDFVHILRVRNLFGNNLVITIETNLQPPYVKPEYLEDGAGEGPNIRSHSRCSHAIAVRTDVQQLGTHPTTKAGKYDGRRKRRNRIAQRG